MKSIIGFVGRFLAHTATLGFARCSPAWLAAV